MALFPFPTALVHEWFSPRSVGGAELVVQQIDQLLQLRCSCDAAALRLRCCCTASTLLLRSS